MESGNPLTTLHVDVANLDACDPKIIEDWHLLVRRCGAPVFAGPDFKHALRQAFGVGQNAIVAVVRDETQRPLAVFPAVVQIAKLGGIAVREVAHVRNPHTILNSLLIDPDLDSPLPVLVELLSALKSTHKWDSLYLHNVTAPDHLQSAMLDALNEAALSSSGWESDRTVCYASLPDTYVAAWSGNFRRQQRKFRRLAESIGPVKAVRFSSREDILAHLPVLFDIEKRSWQGGSDASAMGEKDKVFMRVLAESLSDSQRGDLWLLYIADRPAAALRMLADTGKQYVHTMHFDPAFEKVSPGSLLFEHMIQDAIARGVSGLDCHGDSRFFRRWCPTVRQCHSLRIFRRSPVGLALYAMRSTVRSLRRIKPDVRDPDVGRV
jgi:CelD/BcsL family acetyltransferase involved in cellulose biosynthesis